MSDEMQALCFLAGANSIFYGEKLLTTGNPDVERDQPVVCATGVEAGARSGRAELSWQRGHAQAAPQAPSARTVGAQ